MFIMVKAENLVVEGEYFVPCDNLMTLKKRILEAMSQDISFVLTSEIALTQKSAVLNFLAVKHVKKPSLTVKLRKLLKIWDKEDVVMWQYFKTLKERRDDYPFEVIFFIKYKKRKGFIVKVESKPSIYFKIAQRVSKRFPDEREYSFIIKENKDFIERVMTAIGGRELKGPEVSRGIVEISILPLLRKYGFPKVANLLENGANKINRGDTEDGLTDLREALDKFLKQLLSKKGVEAKRLLEDNLKLLKSNNYLQEQMYVIIYNMLYKWLYSYLSQEPVHQRKKIRIYDAKFLFSVSEKLMVYLLEKVL